MAGKGPKLDHKTAHKLLDKLSNDDDVRTLFESSPLEALTQLGWQPEATAERTGLAAGTSACLASSVTLASKDAIAADRDALVDSLAMPFQFKPPAGLLA
jgi:putative modified peptide